MTSEFNVFLGLGSNLGNCKQILRNAVQALADLNSTKLVAVSSYYESRAVGPPGQGNYFNAVVQLNTNLPPEYLLDLCQAIESDAGRVRAVHWGPRTLDIDVLLFGDQCISTERLTVPHPYLNVRDFVVLPLLELQPQLMLPDGTMLASIRDQLEQNIVDQQPFDIEILAHE